MSSLPDDVRNALVRAGRVGSSRRDHTQGYRQFARDMIAQGVISDPWLEGEPRFVLDPFWLRNREYHAMCEAAEVVAYVHNAIAQVLDEHDELLDSFLSLTRWQKAMWYASAPQWHGIARADVFQTREGLRVCELNSDTPSGQAEASLFQAWIHARHPSAINPNAGLEQAFCTMIELSAQQLRSRTSESGSLRVGIVYPTELPEDLSMIRMYEQWCRRRGWSVELGSPFNLTAHPSGGVALFGKPCDVLLRHYKCDWWSERVLPCLDQSEVQDSDPLVEPLQIVLRAVMEGQCVVVNPFGSVVTQNKRAMALLFEQPELFAPEVIEMARAYIPTTMRLESVKQLESERARWVLKSSYGCEGQDVIVGRWVDDATWNQAIENARLGHWIAQEYFETETSMRGRVNYGVYVACGRACGVFGRVHPGATDWRAQVVPVLVEAEG